MPYDSTFQPVVKLPFETRSISGTGVINDVDVKQGIVDAYFSHFGTRDSYKTVILRGAYSDTLKDPAYGMRAKHYWQHNLNLGPIGSPQEIREDETGLRVISKLKIHPDVPEANRALALYEDGLLEHSVGTITRRMDTKRNISRMDLLEYSSVSIGANQNATLNELRFAHQGFSDQLQKGELMDSQYKKMESYVAELDQRMVELRAMMSEFKPNEDVDNRSIQVDNHPTAEQASELSATLNLFSELYF